MTNSRQPLHTALSPALLHLYDLSHAIVVIVDVLRATSTIATALYNGAKCVIPVDSVAKCIELGRQIDGITAGRTGWDDRRRVGARQFPLRILPRVYWRQNPGADDDQRHKIVAYGPGQGRRPDHYRLVSQSRTAVCYLSTRSESTRCSGMRRLERPGQYRRPALSPGRLSTR
jgi:hypothetical protein